MTDIRPNTKIESEIFPKELTRNGAEKDVFTPPDHQQLKFAHTQHRDQSENFGPEEHADAEADDDAGGFFLTEDLRHQPGRVDNESEAIAEERSYGSERD